MDTFLYCNYVHSFIFLVGIKYNINKYIYMKL